MVCEFKQLTSEFLFGSLDREATVRALDHLRKCDECRSYLTDNSRIAAGRNDEAAPPPDRRAERAARITVPDEDETPYVPFASSESGAWLESARPKRRGFRFLFLGAAVALALLVPKFMGSKSASKKGPSPGEVLALEAVDNGRPYVSYPRETVNGRPKVMSAILLAGEDRFAVKISKGRDVVWEKSFTRADRQATFDRIRLPRADGSFAFADEALLPFPTAEELPLDLETVYSVWICLANGNESLTSAFRVKGN